MVSTTNPPVLTDSKTLSEVVKCLTKHATIKTQGKCEQNNIFEILIRAATQRDSVENTSKVLKNVTRSKKIHYHLEKYQDLPTLESDLNKALQSRLPDGVRQVKQKIAIDFNLIPYYGEPSPQEAPYIYRSQAKSGTCSFYAYATLYVIKKNKRVTLAIKAVRKQDTLVAIITYLLALIEPVELRIESKSFIEYFRHDQDWGDGGMTEVVQRQFQMNRRDEFVKAFVQEAITRVVKPLTDNSAEPESDKWPQDERN